MTESNKRQPVRKVVRNFLLFGFIAGSLSLILGIISSFIGPFLLLGPDSAYEIASRLSLPIGGVCGGVAGFSASIIAGIMTYTAKHDEKFKFGWFFAI